MTPATRYPSSITKMESQKDKMYDQIAINYLKKEFFCEMKHHILSLQQDHKTDFMDEYINIM